MTARNSANEFPTERQRKFLQVAEDYGLGRNITKISKDAGVPRRTVYNWFEDERFILLWDAVPLAAVRKHLPSITAAQIHSAIAEGDTSAARLIMEFAGKIKQIQERREEHHYSFKLDFSGLNDDERDVLRNSLTKIRSRAESNPDRT